MDDNPYEAPQTRSGDDQTRAAKNRAKLFDQLLMVLIAILIIVIGSLVMWFLDVYFGIDSLLLVFVLVAVLTGSFYGVYRWLVDTQK